MYYLKILILHWSISSTRRTSSPWGDGYRRTSWSDRLVSLELGLFLNILYVRSNSHLSWRWALSISALEWYLKAFLSATTHCCLYPSSFISLDGSIEATGSWNTSSISETVICPDQFCNSFISLYFISQSLYVGRDILFLAG